VNTAWTEGWRVERHHMPFSWALIEGFLDEDNARVLIDTFPTGGFREAGDGTTGYRFWFRRLISAGHIASDVRFLHPCWLGTTTFLASRAFINSIAATLGIAATGDLQVDAGVCVYNSRSGLAPHTDRPHRVMTQVLYLNREWKEGWGGELQLLGSADPGDVVHSIAPIPNRAVTMLRSGSSWHAVTPPTQEAPRHRRSLLLHLTRESAEG
jgi:hypothetical protein